MIKIFDKLLPSSKYDEPKGNSQVTPWLIVKVANGLKAVNGKPSRIKFFVDKKLPVKYYEYDRIFGKGAFTTVMRVMDIFGELQSITPKTEHFIFEGHNYINRDDGILRKNHKTKEEQFFSNETLRNENIANYFSLTYNEEPEAEQALLEIEDNETNPDRAEVHNSSPQLESSQS